MGHNNLNNKNFKNYLYTLSLSLFSLDNSLKISIIKYFCECEIRVMSIISFLIQKYNLIFPEIRPINRIHSLSTT